MSFFVLSASYPKVSLDTIAQLSAMSTTHKSSDRLSSSETLNIAHGQTLSSHNPRLDLQRLHQSDQSAMDLNNPELAHEVSPRIFHVNLATCNRFELYVHIPDKTKNTKVIDADTITQLLHKYFIPCINYAEFKNLFDIYEENKAAEHLFQTILGLQSAVLGEQEISRQIRAAYHVAHKNHDTDSLLNKTFQKAFQLSKTVASNTDLGARGASLVSLGLDTIVEDIENYHTLVIGTGAYAGAIIARLKERGVYNIVVFSPTDFKRAQQFAIDHKVAAIDRTYLDKFLEDSNLIIGSSGNTEDQLFSFDHIHSISHTSPQVNEKKNHLRYFIDFSLTSDFDPSIKQLENTHLTTLEQLIETAQSSKETHPEFSDSTVNLLIKKALQELTQENTETSSAYLQNIKESLQNQGFSPAEIHDKLLDYKKTHSSNPQFS